MNKERDGQIDLQMRWPINQRFCFASSTIQELLYSWISPANFSLQDLYHFLFLMVINGYQWLSRLAWLVFVLFVLAFGSFFENLFSLWSLEVRSILFLFFLYEISLAFTSTETGIKKTREWRERIAWSQDNASSSSISFSFMFLFSQRIRCKSSVVF